MLLTVRHAEKTPSGCFFSGYFACFLAPLFLFLITTHGHSADIRDNKIDPLIPHTHNDFLSENARVELFNEKSRIYLPYNKILIISGNIYAIRQHHLFSSLMSSLEFNKRASITGFGATGTIKWPLIQEKNWTIHFNGKISSARLNTVTLQHRNRWNFEHQLGGGTEYNFNDIIQLSLNIYHYRIINDAQYENPATSYIKSSGGFAALKFQF